MLTTPLLLPSCILMSIHLTWIHRVPTRLLLGELVGASDWSCPEYRPLMFADERAIRSLIENKQQARSECSVGSLVAVEACDKTCVFRRKVIGFGRGYSVARRTGEGS